jgi:DNA-binding NarL/FixJ family response regulator
LVPNGARAVRLATTGSAVVRAAREGEGSAPFGRIVVIDERLLTRDLLKRGLEMVCDVDIVAAASVEEWFIQSKDQPATLVVLCLPPGKPLPDTQKMLAVLGHAPHNAPIVVMADPSDDVEFITWMLDQGARGYIATDLPLDVAFQAMRLVSAGGTYVPAGCLQRARKNLGAAAPKPDPISQMFTVRQAAVVDALRRGKANKTIAHELNMHESTVKVHVRNIMKKLNARNRTEVAYMTNDLLEPDRTA